MDRVFPPPPIGRARRSEVTRAQLEFALALMVTELRKQDLTQPKGPQRKANR
jgi:hypothetical protein